MRVVMLWHLHQPDYRVDGAFTRPWVYLHALSGYTDMAAQLESSPAMRAVVNLTPVLLDQLDDYAGRLAAWRRDGRPIGDPLLDALVELPPAGPARAAVVRTCLTALEGRRARRHPHFHAHAEAASRQDPEALPDGLFADLLVWFHLAWLGKSLRAVDARAGALFERVSRLDRADRYALLELIADAVSRVIPRWRSLADDPRVELATSPFYHPLSPLLLDFGAALDRAPSAELPSAPYPGGETRLSWQTREGLARFGTLLGSRPAGCWPPEAALSEETLRQLAQAGFEWTAGSQSVLDATLTYHDTATRGPYRLFRSADAGICCAFRDDGLSDRIGFEYQHWQPADAARDLVQHLEAIAREPGRDLALIALDGENPWEYYPDEGDGFLRGLYQALTTHPLLRPATMRDCLRELGQRATPLPRLRAGSWVHGELLTWVGHPEKNRAWEMLIEAKRRFDASGAADHALAHLLGACEGSDWFWWPGVHNPTPAVAQFDELYRAKLASLYRGLGLSPPESLARPFATGVGHQVAAGGTMQRGA
jgi:alpha-amylase/alpha-mannosidase (GH57 family)